MILIIDNYDSFTYNIYQYVGSFDNDVNVVKNDMITFEEIKKLKPKKIIISPGPGHPKDSKVSLECIQKLDKVQILGICLGHQAIGVSYGAEIINSNQIVHGKTSMITHKEDVLFTGLNNPFEATRYHSLIIDRYTMPGDFEMIAESEALLMGIKHKNRFLYGLQFHPESVKTENGIKIIENFLNI